MGRIRWSAGAIVGRVATAVVHNVTHPVTHPRVSPDEFEALQWNAGWEMAAELIAGEVVVTPPIAGPASSSQGDLYFELRSWNRVQSKPGLLLQDVFVGLPDGSKLAPDISWWPADSGAEVPRLGPVQIMPSLAVEVLSPSTRANDLGPKRELYMWAGVRELWLVDPDERTLTRVLADPARSADGAAQTLTAGDTLTSELLPGFALPLAQAF